MRVAVAVGMNAAIKRRVSFPPTIVVQNAAMAAILVFYPKPGSPQSAYEAIVGTRMNDRSREAARARKWRKL